MDRRFGERLGGIQQTGETTAVARAKYAAPFYQHSCSLCGSVSVGKGISANEAESRALAIRNKHYQKIAQLAARGG